MCIRDRFDSNTGGGVPGNYDDRQQDYFTQIKQHYTLMRKRTNAYARQFMRLLRPPDIVAGQADGTLATTPRVIDLSPVVAAGINLLTEPLRILNNNVHGNNIIPTNAAALYPLWWSTAVSAFCSAPYAFLHRDQGNPNRREYFRRALMDETRVGTSGMDETFKFGQSPYLSLIHI